MRSLSRVIKPEQWQFGRPLRLAAALAGSVAAAAAAGCAAAATAGPDAASAAATPGAGAGDGPAPDATAVRAEVGRATAERQAAEIIAAARARAEELIDEAVRGAERLAAEARQTAYEEGRREGYAAGRREAETEAAAMRSQAEELLRMARAEREEQLQAVRAEIARLAVSVAEKILRRRLNDDPELVVAMVGEAIRRAHNGETLRVRANPRDVPLIEAHEGELAASVAGLKNLELIEDLGIAPGGCVVETGHGYIDARIDSQLELVENALRAAVNDGGDAL